jgi:hypothetical protein
MTDVKLSKDIKPEWQYFDLENGVHIIIDEAQLGRSVRIRLWCLIILTTIITNIV